MMKKLLLLLTIILAFVQTRAQVSGTYNIKGADTVKMYKNNGGTELVLKNASDTVLGFLYNSGSGITYFRHGLIKINDTTYLVGSDTLKIKTTNNNGAIKVGNGLFYYGPDSVGLGGVLFGSTVINGQTQPFTISNVGVLTLSGTNVNFLASNSMTIDGVTSTTINPSNGITSLNPNGGNVGIGTASPSYKLDVNGSVRLNQLPVSTSNLDSPIVKDRNTGQLKITPPFSVISGVSSFNTRTGAVTLAQTDVVNALGYLPWKPSDTTSTLSTIATARRIADSAALASVSGVSSFNTRTGAVTLNSTDVTTALGYVPYHSTDTTSTLSTIATARRIADSVAATVGTVTSIVSGYGLTGGPITTAGTLKVDTTSMSTIATARRIADSAAGSVTAGVSSFNTRTGAITLNSTDIKNALGYTPYDSLNPKGYISSSSIATATDATITSPANGQFLHYNGTKWVNYLLSSSDVTGALGYTPYHSTDTTATIATIATARRISDSAAGAVATQSMTLYQPLENQRLSTTNRPQFMNLNVIDTVNAGNFYGNGQVELPALSVVSDTGQWKPVAINPTNYSLVRFKNWPITPDTAYTSNTPILINATNRIISADTANQTTGLSTISGARRIADSAVYASGAATPFYPVHGTTNQIVVSHNGLVKGDSLTISLAPNLVVADTTVDSATLSNITGSNGITVQNGTHVIPSTSNVLVTIAAAALDSSRFTQSPTAIIKSTITASVPIIFNSTNAQITADTATNVSGLLTRSDGRRIADSAAAQAVGAPYSANQPININNRVISADSSNNVSGLLTRADGRRIADSAANTAGIGAGVNVQWVYGIYNNIPAKGRDSLYINTGLTGKHLMISATNSSTTIPIVDSVTWALAGANPNMLYFKHKLTTDTIVFCNTQNVNSFVTGTVVSIFGGAQGYPAAQDTGTGTFLPPTVNAGANQNVTYPASTATLTGSASSNNVSGSITSYNWTIVSEPAGAAATIASPTNATTAVNNMALVGAYTYQLAATDNFGASNSANTTVTVVNQLAALFNFSSSAAPVSSYTNVYGNPGQTGGITFTDATTGWTLSSAGLTANWQAFGGFWGNNTIGVGGGSSDGAFTQAAMNNNMFNYNRQYSANNYGFKFTNLPAGTYTIELIGSSPSGSFNNNGIMQAHVQFGTGADNYASFDPTVGTGGNLTPAGPGTTNVTSGTFTGTITAGQIIQFGVFAGPTNVGQAGFINALKIVKIN